MDVISPAADFVVLFGTALLTLGALLAGGWKIYERIDGWDHTGERQVAADAKLETLIGTVSELAGKVDSVVSEVTSNGGSSMKDRLEGLTEQFAEHGRRGDERHRVIDDRIAAVEDSLTALHAQLTRHDPSAE